MAVIGLTGGIASGKTTVSNYLAKLGAEIIDADIVARQIVAPGSPALKEITLAFGTGILHADGTLNRKKLGELVFNNPADLQKLNQITHPKIYEIIKQKINLYKSNNTRHKPPLVLVAPLLIEVGLHKLVDKVWVVVIDLPTQIQRVMARDNISRELALKKINSQLSNEERLKYADAVIDNSRSWEYTKEQILKLWALHCNCY